MSERPLPIRLTMLTSPQDLPYAPLRRVTSLVDLGLIKFKWMISAILLAVMFSAATFASQYVFSHYLIHSIKIVGISMVPTLEENSKYIVDNWAMVKGMPQRNDIVVFRDPGDNGLSVKRVVAVPGDSILFKDGVVFLNGHQLKEDYLMGNVRTYTYSQAKEQFITVGVGQYFLLGDNRPASIDCRSYGPVNREDILGVVKVNDKLPL